MRYFESCLHRSLYFLVQWLDGEDSLYDTIPARGLTPPKGVDILNVLPGDLCKASFANKLYDVKILAVGKAFFCVARLMIQQVPILQNLDSIKSLIHRVCPTLFIGSYTEMKREQAQKEEEVEANDDDREGLEKKIHKYPNGMVNVC